VKARKTTTGRIVTREDIVETLERIDAAESEVLDQVLVSPPMRAPVCGRISKNKGYCDVILPTAMH
jgi:translation initiation factor IF-3